MRVSVIIPNLHSPLIGAVVAAVAQQTVRERVAEVLVVGQDRHGLTPAWVRRIDTPRPVAAGVARNLGARSAGGDILLFLDSDCIAAPDLVERLIARHAAGHQVVGGGVVIERADYWSDCDNLLIFAPFLDSTPAGPRAFLPSLCLSIERALFTSFGGFDERYAGAAGEDMDLCLRLRAAGRELFLDPSARVTHRARRGSAGAAFGHLRAYGRAYARVRRDHPSLLPTPLGRVPPRLSLPLIAAAPALALADAAALALRHPALAARPALIPGVAWAKLGWYLGVLEARAVAGAAV